MQHAGVLTYKKSYTLCYTVWRSQFSCVESGLTTSSAGALVLVGGVGQANGASPWLYGFHTALYGYQSVQSLFESLVTTSTANRVRQGVAVVNRRRLKPLRI